MLRPQSFFHPSWGFGLLVFTSISSSIGCASFPGADESVTDAMASVRGAEEVGAADIPDAALKLQLAREELEAAQALLEERDEERAYYTAKRASEDADLAIALVRENEARKSSSTATERVQTAAEIAEETP